MIYWINSSLPRFKFLEFRPGLNIVLADRAPNSTDRQTRNGAGKSSILDVIHFLLGSNVEKDSIFKKPELVDADFSMNFDLAGSDVTPTRTGREPSKIRVSGAGPSWPIKPVVAKDTLEPTITNTNWRAVLGNLMFGLPVEENEAEESLTGPSFRSLISYFVRRSRTGGLISPERFAEKQQLGDQQISLSFLLGLDWTIPARWDQVRVREKSLKELRRIISEGQFGSIVGSSAELRTELAIAEDAVRKLRASLDEFRVVPEYAGLEKEASTLSGQIADLSDANTADRMLLEDLRRSLSAERPPEAGDVTRVYEEAGVVLPELVRRRFEDVRAFHESVLRNRRSYLEAEVDAANNRISSRESQMADLDRRRSEVMGVLRSGGALEHYSQLQAELARREAGVELLRQRYKAAQQLETQKTELDIERSQLLVELRRDYEEQEVTLNRAILTFEQVSEALYEKAGQLRIEPTPNGPKFSVVIDGSLSKGISNMQIFCFDMMLMQVCAERGIGPGFLVHDSHIFDGVDNRQIAKALQVGATLAAKYKFQYLVTLNSDTAPEGRVSDFSIEPYVVPKRLLDDGETGGLFGVRF